MTAIKQNFGEGGANLAPGGAAGDPDLATTLRDIADDLAAVHPANLAAATAGGALAAFTGATVGASIAAFTDPPSAAEMALLRTFVNALKVDHAATLAELATTRTLINALRADLADARTKLGATTPASYTVKTTKV